MRDAATPTRRRTTPTTTWAHACAQVDHWRHTTRPQVLRTIAEQTMGLGWSRRLLQVLLDELHVDEEFNTLVRGTRRLTLEHAAQAIALALVLRHSWTPHDLASLMRRLQIAITSTSSAPAPPTLASSGAKRSRPPRTSAVRRTRAARGTRPEARRS